MNCKGVIEVNKNKENSTIIYKINYSKAKEFLELTNEDIDAFFKFIISRYINGYSWKLDSETEYKETAENDVIKIFFETFFEELKTSEDNMKTIKSIHSEFQPILNDMKTDTDEK